MEKKEHHHYRKWENDIHKAFLGQKLDKRREQANLNDLTEWQELLIEHLITK